MPTINIIAAMANNRVIGKDNKIPWHLHADLKHFVKLTGGHPVIMGRITFESILEKLGYPLPGRTNVILTGQSDYDAPGCLVVHSWEEAIEQAKKLDSTIFVAGGKQIYQLVLPHADKIFLTEVDVECEGDTFFPDFSESEWELMEKEQHEKDEKNPYDYAFLTYRRRA